MSFYFKISRIGINWKPQNPTPLTSPGAVLPPAAAIMRLMAWICTKWMSFNIQCKQMSNPFPHWDCMYEERTHRVWSRPTFYRSSLLKTWGKTYTKGSFSIETRFTQWQDMAGWRVEVLRDHATTLNHMLNSSEHNVFSLWVSYFLCFVFNWGGIKPQRTQVKEVWPNPISVSMGD